MAVTTKPQEREERISEELQNQINELVERGVLSRQEADAMLYVFTHGNLTQSGISVQYDRDVNYTGAQIAQEAVLIAQQRFREELGDVAGERFGMREISIGDVLRAMWVVKGQKMEFDVTGRYERQFEQVLNYAQKRGLFEAREVREALGFYSFLLSNGYTHEEARNIAQRYYSMPVGAFVSTYGPLIRNASLKGGAMVGELATNPWRYYPRFRIATLRRAIPVRLV